MGKEQITIEVDAELMARLRAEGVDPQAYVERLANRRLANPTESSERLRQWCRENREWIDSYSAEIEARGVFSDGVRGW